MHELRPDGIPQGRAPDVPLPERRMAAGDESYFFAPVYAGDVITSTRRLAAIEEKAGRSGPFLLVSWATGYVNQDDVVVGRILSTMIAR